MTVALQLGALRDALLSAGVPKDKADAAAEEVAGWLRRQGMAPLPDWFWMVIVAGAALFAAGMAFGAFVIH
jgi:hypothetical protein